MIRGWADCLVVSLGYFRAGGLILETIHLISFSETRSDTYVLQEG